jgi:hypothetical protein
MKGFQDEKCTMWLISSPGRHPDPQLYAQINRNLIYGFWSESWKMTVYFELLRSGNHQLLPFGN